MIHPYRESVLSQLHPGYQHSSNALVPAVLLFEQVLKLPPPYHRKVIWRLDQGFGGDANINWLLQRHYGVLAKGCSNRRAAKLAAEVKRWYAVREDKFIGRVSTPAPLGGGVETFSVRYATKKGWKYSYLLSTLGCSGRATMRLYDGRGGAETGFRSDKSGGLQLHKRRKHRRDAQEAWVLLTDMVHNYLSWFARTILIDSPLASLGFLRMSRDLLHVPGYVEMEDGKLLSVKLLRSSPYAGDLLACLQRFWQ